MKGLFKLLLRYVYASESLFFILIMPLILFGLLGEGMIFGINQNDPTAQTNIAISMITGISGTSVISSALFLIPITIVDFKNSVLMKRIGATNVKPWQFLVLIMLLFIIQSSFSFFYSRFIATMLYGWRLNWNIAFVHNVGYGYLLTGVTMLVAISVGMVIASISPNVRRVTVISNIIYFPISILSGGFVPAAVVYKSSFLRNLTWINPFKYAIEPYLEQQGSLAGTGYSLEHWQYIMYPFVVLGVVGFCFYLVSKNLKWSS